MIINIHKALSQSKDIRLLNQPSVQKVVAQCVKYQKLHPGSTLNLLYPTLGKQTLKHCVVSVGHNIVFDTNGKNTFFSGSTYLNPINHAVLFIKKALDYSQVSKLLGDK